MHYSMHLIKTCFVILFISLFTGTYSATAVSSAAPAQKATQAVAMYQGPLAGSQNLTKPVMRDGCYYNNANDHYKHIDYWRIAKGIALALVSPTAWNEFFFAAPFKNSEQMPAPLQTVPCKQSEEPIITWIGHASFLIQMGNFNILTDPIFGGINVDRGIIHFTIKKRIIEPGIKLEDLPPIDAIVISHNHSDHMDTTALTALAKKYDPVIFVPEGNEEDVAQMGFTHIVENSWWDSYTLAKDQKQITFSCLPAYHWSIRFSFDSYRTSLWSSWMITYNNKNVYFAGDTAYAAHFKEIATLFPSIDVALMPIGPTTEEVEDEEQDAHSEHKECHVDAHQAIDAFVDLNARCFIPMHYGTFAWGKDALEYPLPQLHKYWEKDAAKLKGKKLLVAQCGKQYILQEMQ